MARSVSLPRSFSKWNFPNVIGQPFTAIGPTRSLSDKGFISLQCSSLSLKETPRLASRALGRLVEYRLVEIEMRPIARGANGLSTMRKTVHEWMDVNRSGKGMAKKTTGRKKESVAVRRPSNAANKDPLAPKSAIKKKRAKKTAKTKRKPR